MANIKLKNLSRDEALSLLQNVQLNHAPSLAIQGEEKCKWLNTETVNATVKVQYNDFHELDFSKNTFEIYSTYWTESTLYEFVYN